MTCVVTNVIMHLNKLDLELTFISRRYCVGRIKPMLFKFINTAKSLRHKPFFFKT